MNDKIHSWMGIPLLVHDKVIGMITIDSRRYNYFTPEHLHIASALADQVAIAIENAHLFRQAQYEKTFFETLINNIPSAIAVVSEDYKVVAWNKGASSIFGYTFEEAIGKDIDTLVANQPEIYKEAVHYTELSRRGEILHVNTRRTRKDGTLFDIELSVVPVTLNDQEVGKLVIYHDITELQQARKAAEAASRAKSSFLANMSHEIRTPMNAIIGFTELLERDQRLVPDQKDNIRIIHHSTEALLDLINNILDLSKIEAGRMVVTENSFNLDNFLENLKNMFQLRANQKNLSFALTRSGSLPTAIVSDEAKLRQILMNLMGNAIKFTQYGRVELQVQPWMDQDKTDPHQLLLHFLVIDTGIGIAGDELGMLFQPFMQTSSGLISQQGTGLGLAICEQAVQLLNGKIWASSSPGQGSTFEFMIPVKVGDAQDNGHPESSQVKINPGSTMPAKKVTSPLTKFEPNFWKQMPADWLSSLKNAVTEGDLDQVRLLAKDIKADYPDLAAVLTDLANHFNLNMLNKLLPK
jgi:PAS domain S-box-containing protein